MTALKESRVRGKVPANTLGARLVLIRREVGVTQREAADQTGVPFGTWQGMESGRATRRLDEWVGRICDTYGYDPMWLMWGKLPDDTDPNEGLSTRRARRDSNPQPSDPKAPIRAVAA